jgi:hypothetical protein
LSRGEYWILQCIETGRLPHYCSNLLLVLLGSFTLQHGKKSNQGSSSAAEKDKKISPAMQ